MPADTPYFTVLGFERDGLSCYMVGPVMPEQEIIETAVIQGGDSIVPASSSYDGEQLDAALEFLNDNGRIFEVYECATDAARFIERAESIGHGVLARNVVAGWHRRARIRAVSS